MDRTISYHMPKEYEGHKISEYLHNRGYSNPNLAALRHSDGAILLNGREVFMNTRLKEGDLLTVNIRETEVSGKIPPVELPFEVLYEDEDLLVVNKPADMPIHPSMKNYYNTLGNAAAWYFAKQGKPFVYRCVNRLDRDTTGLTIIAKHTVSCSILYDAVKDRRIEREYTAIVCGEDLPDSGTVDLPLGRAAESVVERTVDFEHGDRAVTHYRVIDRGKGLCALKLHLETGRTHQIRVHMKAIGHPLIGDWLYNPTDTHMKRQALHAGKLSFPHPMTGEPMTFEAPLPADMQAVLADLQKIEE